MEFKYLESLAFNGSSLFVTDDAIVPDQTIGKNIVGSSDAYGGVRVIDPNNEAADFEIFGRGDDKTFDLIAVDGSNRAWEDITLEQSLESTLLSELLGVVALKLDLDKFQEKLFV